MPPGAAHAQEDGFHVEAGRTPAALNGPLHHIERMLVEQVQDADVMPHAAARAVLPLQGGTQFLEDRRQMPAAKDVGVVQRRRPTPQRVQVMPRIEDLLVFAVRTRV